MKCLLDADPFLGLSDALKVCSKSEHWCLHAAHRSLFEVCVQDFRAEYLFVAGLTSCFFFT